MLDLVRLGSTTEAAVPYMRQTTYTSAAVEVAEATSTTTGTKPEAALPFERVDSPVEEITSWVPATRRALEDVDEMRGVIDSQLLFDARRRLEAQALAGNGTTPNLRGLDTTTGVQAQAKGADSVPLALAKGLALVMNAGFAPTACVLNPDDWVDGMSVILTNGGSSLGDVLEVPVVKSASVAAGTGYVGDWNQLVVWLRSTEVFVSIAHSDWFTRNLGRGARRDEGCRGRARAGGVRSRYGDLGRCSSLSTTSSAGVAGSGSRYSSASPRASVSRHGTFCAATSSAGPWSRARRGPCRRLAGSYRRGARFARRPAAAGPGRLPAPERARVHT